VNSPTFIIINEHPGGRLPFFHADAYRLEDVDEARHAGVFDERQAEGVTVIEWADRLEAWLPADHLRIELDADPSGPDRRVVRLFPFGVRHQALARAVVEAGPG
jgi:tRNA threonylcarbamoyladenosine biosynthesis protein TsaE